MSSASAKPPPDPDAAGRTDHLSPAATAILQLGGDSTYEQLVPHQPGSAKAQSALSALSAETLLIAPPTDALEANCLLAALWLRHDFLDPAHRIVQDVPTPTGSYWHAILHRREGDFSNSKYWYARAAAHPAYTNIAPRAAELIRPYSPDKSLARITAHGWNPTALVDLVESMHKRPTDERHALAVSLQRLEWQVLFDTGVQRAFA
jgi:hypothetical protein